MDDKARYLKYKKKYINFKNKIINGGAAATVQRLLSNKFYNDIKELFTENHIIIN